MTLMTYSRHGFKGQGHRQHFPKIHFLVKVYWSTVCCWSLDDLLFFHWSNC